MPRKDRTMAIATEEIVEQTENVETQNEETNTEETGSKRQRIDIDKLAAEKPHEKVTQSFQVPAEMRVLARKRAESENKSEADWCRDVLAEKLGYTIPENFLERKSRAGMSEEDKAKQAAEQRQNVANLLKLAQEKANENPELAALLASAGVDITKLPTVRGPRKKKDA